MNNLLLLPPLCFVIVFFTVWGLGRMCDYLAPKSANAKGKEEAYACGEEYTNYHIEPDYNSFFRFAVFFTIIDVAGLTVASLAASSQNISITIAAVIYTVVLSCVLAILYSK